MTYMGNRTARTELAGIIFDMGDILHDATHWRRWLWGWVSQYGVTLEFSQFCRKWDVLLDAVHRGVERYEIALDDFLRMQGLTPEQRHITLTQSAKQKPLLERDVVPFVGVIPTLEQLHGQNIPMAILSDSESPKEKIKARLSQWGIDGFISHVISSRDLGCTKPHPRGYHVSAELLGTSCEETAFVGHDAEELSGAAAVGMLSVAFNHEPDAISHVYLHRFEDLLTLVRERTGYTGGRIAA